MNTLIEEVISAAGGGLDATSLRERGVSTHALNSAVKRGDLARVGRGAYLTPPTGVRPEAAHALRAKAVLHTLPAATVLTHHSALAYWDLPTYGADLTTVHVGRLAKPSVTAAGGRRWHRLPEDTPLERPTPEGSTAVTPAVAIVQVALTSPRAGLVAADEARRRSDPRLNKGRIGRGAATAEEVAEALALYRRTPGILGARAMAAEVDPRAESPGETLLRRDVRNLGFDVEPQFVVPLPDGVRHYRVDLRVCGRRVLLEFDGDGKYEGGDARARAAAREAERRRERELRALGWAIARFTWRDIGRPEEIRRRIETAV